MQRRELVAFLRRYNLAAQASVAPDGSPQAAIVGFGVSDTLELMFDTLDVTRKYRKLRYDPRVALVVGRDDQISGQIEGGARP